MRAFVAPAPLCGGGGQRRSACRRRAPPRASQSQQDAAAAAEAAENSAMAAAAATYILKKASDAYVRGGRRPDAATVESAMLALEREQRQNKAKSDVERLYGQWRLVFTADSKASTPFTKALYFPLRAQQTVCRAENGTENEGVFDNGVFWFGGGASFRLSGPMRWEAKMNRMNFTVDRVAVKIGEWKWEKDGLEVGGVAKDGSPAKVVPFLTFFAVRADIACARGRGGGIALYARVPDGEYL